MGTGTPVFSMEPIGTGTQVIFLRGTQETGTEYIGSLPDGNGESKTAPKMKGAGIRDGSQFANWKRIRIWEPKRMETYNEKIFGTRNQFFGSVPCPSLLRSMYQKNYREMKKYSRVTTWKLKNVPCDRVSLNKRPVNKTKKWSKSRSFSWMRVPARSKKNQRQVSLTAEFIIHEILETWPTERSWAF